jgi:hypothetical protein
MVLAFVGAGATDTARRFSGLSLKGIVEPTVVVATGALTTVALGPGTDPDFSLLAVRAPRSSRRRCSTASRRSFMVAA